MLSVIVVAGLLTGCQQGRTAHRDIIQRELRLQEDQIYLLQDDLSDSQQRVKYYQSENDKLKQQLEDFQSAEDADGETSALSTPKKGAAKKKTTTNKNTNRSQGLFQGKLFGPKSEPDLPEGMDESDFEEPKIELPTEAAEEKKFDPTDTTPIDLDAPITEEGEEAGEWIGEEAPATTDTSGADTSTTDTPVTETKEPALFESGPAEEEKRFTPQPTAPADHPAATPERGADRGTEDLPAPGRYDIPETIPAPTENLFDLPAEPNEDKTSYEASEEQQPVQAASLFVSPTKQRVGRKPRPIMKTAEPSGYEFSHQGSSNAEPREAFGEASGFKTAEPFDRTLKKRSIPLEKPSGERGPSFSPAFEQQEPTLAEPELKEVADQQWGRPAGRKPQNETQIALELENQNEGLQQATYYEAANQPAEAALSSGELNSNALNGHLLNSEAEPMQNLVLAYKIKNDPKLGPMLLVKVKPTDQNGKPVSFTGDLALMVLRPKNSPTGSRFVARWNLSKEDLLAQANARQLGTTPVYLFELSMPELLTETEPLELWARAVSTEGNKSLSSMSLKVNRKQLAEQSGPQVAEKNSLRR